MIANSTEQVKIPDAIYSAKWTAYNCTIQSGDQFGYQFKTDKGIKGINVSCVVIVNSGKALVSNNSIVIRAISK